MLKLKKVIGNSKIFLDMYFLNINIKIKLADMKFSTTAGDTLPPFRADALSAYTHYPFGMLQPGMYSETGTTYHFGFNGMMRDDDVKYFVFFLTIFNS